MADDDLDIRTIPPARAASLTRRAVGLGPEHIPPVVGPIFPEVDAALRAAGVEHGPAFAQYRPDADGVAVTAGFLIDAPTVVPGVDVADLPGFDRAAVTVHHGTMAGIGDAWMAHIERVEAAGHTVANVTREVYLTEGDVPQEDWDTELVLPVEPAL
jgi:effector-binding domain-containing protein